MPDQEVPDPCNRWLNALLGIAGKAELTGMQKTQACCLYSEFTANCPDPGIDILALIRPSIPRPVEAAEDTEALSPVALLGLGAVLFRDEEYAAAKKIFDLYAKRIAAQRGEWSEQDFRARMLYCYACELLSRKTSDLEPLQAELEALAEADRHVAHDDRWAAEVRHCRGHSLVAKYVLSGSRHDLLRIAATNELETASAINPAYTSCFTSAFSEMNDHLSSVREAHRALKERKFETLPELDRCIVEAEVVFYLSAAYLAIGRFEKAKENLERFRTLVRPLQRPDPVSHAEFFEQRIRLRRFVGTELGEGEIGSMLATVKGLTFEADTSEAIATERDVFADALALLHALAAEPNLREAARRVRDQGLARRVLAHDERFAKIGLHWNPILVVGDPSALPEISEGGAEASSLRTLAAVDQAQLWPGAPLIIVRAAGEIAAEDFEKCSGQHIVFLSPSYEEPQLKSAARSVTWVECERDWLLDAAELALAATVAKQFTTQDRYIFGLAPCDDSPAVLYQKAEIPRELLEDGLDA